MAGVLPAVEVDGRVIGSGRRGPVTARLQALYAALMEREAAAGRDAALDEDEGGR
jgi:branched-chain amino acid aminotransferase